VADLLECVIQIKGVAGTPGRLAARVSSCAADRSPAASSRAASVVRRLALFERRFAECLVLMLGEERPVLPALDARDLLEAGDGEGTTISGWQAQFSARRADTVATLERCSAEELGRIGLEPSRGPMTVADLVAVMLAHDTDCLGEIGPSTR
jgi:hypothetical protein